MGFFKNANLVQLNKNVISLLFERLQVKNELEFFELLDLHLLIITNGKKGAKFVYKENGKLITIKQSPEVLAKVVDSSGAGDAFFATFVQAYAYSNVINAAFISNTFKKANQASRDVISNVGQMNP